MLSYESILADASRLPIADRIELVEAIWDSLPKDAVMPSAEQRAELDQRMDAYEANPENVLTRNQVIEQLRERM
jgi:putative addiction module component (TIGR02574 family)